MDFLAEDFNPELVLSSENEDQVKLPCENVQPLNNLAEYVNRSTAKSRPRQGDCDDRVSCQQQHQSTVEGERRRRGGPVGVVPVFRARRRLKNVLTMMESTTSGPLGRLRRCMDEKTRVKVWTRGSHSMRGVCCGFILAFDRHWNLVVGDADDTFLLVGEAGTSGWWVAKGASGEGTTSNELQLRERHIDQVFVRGDNVAFISIC